MEGFKCCAALITGHKLFYITWYILAVFIGLVDNIFVLVVNGMQHVFKLHLSPGSIRGFYIGYLNDSILSITV